MLVSDLLQFIPMDTKKLVGQTYKRMNGVVRQAIRAETRLILKWKSPDGDDSDSSHTVCSIKVDDIGIPEIIKRIEIPPQFELAAKLQFWLPYLRQLSESATATATMITKLKEDLVTVIRVEDARIVLGEARRYADRLLALAVVDEFNLVDYILAVDDDVLGRYWYNPEEGSPKTSPYSYDLFSEADYDQNPKSQINLYWGIIGLCSVQLHLPIESVTTVVLAHELAHAYTHLGYDRDRTRWTGYGFSMSDRDLKEGLAQYYTYRVTQRLKARFPDLEDAFLGLLKHQSAPYHAHEPWIEHKLAEAIGSALSVMRRKGKVTYSDFDDEVKATSDRLCAASGSTYDTSRPAILFGS